MKSYPKLEHEIYLEQNEKSLKSVFRVDLSSFYVVLLSFTNTSERVIGEHA